MDAVLTSWAFGFGGWIGVFGSTFLFLNVPHNHTLLLLLLSPWIGGISLYLIMFATHAWINVSVQVAAAMTKYEIIMAVLTSCIGVLIVGIARLIIDMERAHRTPAQAAAEESAQAATAATQTPPEVTESAQESVSDEEDSESESDKEDGSDEESSEDGSDADEEDSSEDESGSEETGSDETHTTESANHADNEDSSLNEARIEDSSSSSYENINTPQLKSIATNESPVPNIPDI